MRKTIYPEREKKNISNPSRMNSFFYGNPWEPDASLPRIYPLVCSRLNPAIKFESSTFKINSDKQSSMR